MNLPIVEPGRDLSLRSLVAVVLLSPLVSIPAPGSAQAAGGDCTCTVAGDVVVEPSTLQAIGLEWPIEGDANRNAAVAVHYRVKGASQWREALPMLRIGGEEIRQLPSFDVVTPNMFAGSIFDLAEDTTYEVRLELSDPDGAKGETSKLLTIATRAEPRPFAGGQTYHVYPPDWQGEKLEPSFGSLNEAYNTGASGADWANSFVPRVVPGDRILVHAGTYSQDLASYGQRGGLATIFDGTMYLTAKGTADRPIAIMAAGDGEVIFDGGGNHNLFNLQVADYHYFEGITVRNTDVAFDLGHKRIGGAVGFTLKNSRIIDVGRGVSTDWGGARDFYIADNVFIGRNDPTRLMGWIGATWKDLPGFPQPLLSEYAVKVFGSGHVIAYNRVENFHDGIDHATYGNPDDWPDTPRDRMPVAIDIYNNDIRNVDDNCIEADGVMFNVRVLRNRCFNQAHRALSTQPALGGPVYFIRNIVYNAQEGGALKLTAHSAGVLIYNNTFIAEVRDMWPASNIHYRNNLVLGNGAWPTIFSSDEFTAYSSSDYNGFRPHPRSDRSFAITFVPDMLRSYGVEDRLTREFSSLAEYSRVTGRDENSVIVDFDDFVHVTPPDAADPTRIYDPQAFDFGLTATSRAVDAGVHLPNVTDGSVGKAPDLGALERGQSIHFGPRE